MKKNIEIINLIKEINHLKLKVIEAYENMEMAETLDENSLYYNLCESLMDLCKERLNQLYEVVEEENIEEILLNQYNFKIFDASTIFDYFK